MKKIGLLIALALCVTIGGVYATWIYTSNNAQSMSNSITVSMGDLGSTVTDIGEFTITAPNGIKIEPREGTTHTTGLAVPSDIVITFTPNDFAPVDIKENGPTDAQFQIRFEVQNADGTAYTNQYDNQDIFTVAHGTHALDRADWTQTTTGGKVAYTYTIAAADFANHVDVNPFVLDTLSDYDAFKTAMGTTVNFVCYIENVPTVTP